MRKRISTAQTRAKKRAVNADSNQIAFATVQKTIEASEAEPEMDQVTVSRLMAEMGRKGGRIGGKRRLETMTAKERSDVALRAARTRWAKKREA